MEVATLILNVITTGALVVIATVAAYISWVISREIQEEKDK